MPHILLKPLGDPLAETVGSIDINKAFQVDLEEIFKQAKKLNSSLEEKKILHDKWNALQSFEAQKRAFTGKINSGKIPISLPSLGNLSIKEDRKSVV